MSFRTQLFLSYFILIAVAAGIVYAVAVVQIGNQERLDFEVGLNEAIDETAEDIHDELLLTSENWLCEEIEQLPDRLQMELDLIFEEMRDGEPVDCREIQYGECWELAELLGLNEEEAGEEVSFFCEQRFEQFTSTAVERELQGIISGAAEEWDGHFTLWQVDAVEPLFEVGAGPGFEMDEVERYGAALELFEAFELGELDPEREDENGEVIEYRLRVIALEDDPIYMLAFGASNAVIGSNTQRSALALAGLTAAAGIFLLLLLGRWLVNTLTRPLTDLRRSAQAMAAGQLDTRAATDAPPEIRGLAEDFNRMATAVENMVAEQRAFASNAAHELRTPLTAMRIRTEALLEDEPDEALRQTYVTEIQDEIGRLTRLVEDLRLLSRADAQNLEIGHESVNLVSLVRALDREFSRQIKGKQLNLKLTAPDEIYVVRGSTSHMRVLLRNVIENAIKYTPAGGRIGIDLDYDQAGNHQITVRDTGVGIPAADLPHLTKRFYRVDKAHSRKVPGSGLGLSLVHSIVELYGGRLEVTSEGTERGTTVKIVLPATQNETS